jgi:3-isopropylmalate/(R)-2-methylmalate dehydratase small subunit
VTVRTIASVQGRALPLRGADIDTDRIMPGRFLKTITFEGLEQHVFEDDRKAGGHPFDDARYRDAAVLVVNSNFGCGSSREHAPQALQRRGFRAIVGESFAEIFFGNAVMIGLPCVTAAPDDVARLMDLVEQDPAVSLQIDLTAGTLRAGAFQFAVSLPPKVRDAFLTGAWDTTGMLLDRYEEVDAAAARLPYVAGF